MCLKIKNMKAIYRFSIVFILFTTFGCSELIDCIASTEPELKSKTLRLGYTG